jgi:hypothetical protein
MGNKGRRVGSRASWSGWLSSVNDKLFFEIISRCQVPAGLTDQLATSFPTVDWVSIRGELFAADLLDIFFAGPGDRASLRKPELRSQATCFVSRRYCLVGGVVNRQHKMDSSRYLLLSPL